MFLSPAEIKQQQLRERRGAYERVDVDALLDNVIGSYQHVWLERDGLKARVEELEQEIANTKELEKLLRDGLASAQRAAEQVKQEAEQQVSGLVEEARAKADKLLADAEAKAEAIVAESRERRDRLHEETTRLEQANHDVRERYRAFLLEALSVVEATAEHKAVEPEPEPVAAADESAPVAEEDEELQAPVGWLATVPLTAVATEDVEQSIERPEPEPELEPAAEAEPEPEEDELEPAATVLLSSVAPAEREGQPEESTDEPVLEPVAVEEVEPESEAPAAEEHAEESLADEAYMTFRAMPALRIAEDPPAELAPEADEDQGEDSYEDWSPKKG